MSQDMTRWAAECYAQLGLDMADEYSISSGPYCDFKTKEQRDSFIEATMVMLFNSIKFVLPEEVSLGEEPSLKVDFDDFLKIVRENPMPYEFVALSCFSAFVDGGKGPACFLYWHDEEKREITINAFIKPNENGGPFLRLPLFVTLDIDKGEYRLYSTISEAVAKRDFRRKINGEDELDALAKSSATQAMQALGTLLTLLSCSNVSEREIPISKLKRDRLKKKKLPVFEHKTLYIEDVRSARVDRGGTSSSKRQHHRRGHIRRLSNGNQVWVRPCLVGDPSLGFVSKDYVLRGNRR